jgi:hypothetical protein
LRSALHLFKLLAAFEENLEVRLSDGAVKAEKLAASLPVLGYMGFQSILGSTGVPSLSQASKLFAFLVAIKEKTKNKKNTGGVTQASDQALLRDLALLKPDEHVAKKARVERQVLLPAAVGPAREGEAFPPYGEAKSGEGKVRALMMAC